MGTSIARRRWIAANITAGVKASSGLSPFVSPITAGKVSEYDLRFAKSGQNVLDGTGSGHTLIPGSGSAAPGASTTGATFNGSQSYTDTTGPWLTSNSGFTIQALINATIGPQGAGIVLNSPSSGDAIGITLASSSSVFQAGLDAWAWVLGGSNLHVGYTVISGTWTLLTLLSTPGVLSMTVNRSSTQPNTSTQTLSFGATGENIVGYVTELSVNYQFVGTLAYLAVYDDYLSQTNLDTIYDAMKPAMALSGIVLP